MRWENAHSGHTSSTKYVLTSSKLYARQSLVNFFSAQIKVPLHGDSREVRSWAKAILVAQRLL